jgi:hypothetical protein
MRDPRPRRVSRPAATLIGVPALVLLASLLATANLAACGGQSGGASPAATASPQPAPVSTFSSGKLPASAAQVLTAYFAAVAAQDDGAAAALLTPESPLRDDPLMRIRALHGLRIDDELYATPPPGTSAIVQVGAWLAADGDTAWGPAGPHDFFMVLTQLPGGAWRVDHMATSP